MKSMFKKGAAAALVSLVLPVRMFVGMEIDFADAANAAWICPLLGMVFFLPFLFVLRRVALKGGGGFLNCILPGLPDLFKKVIGLVFAVVLLWDAARMVRLMASSYNVLALNNVTVHLLIFPLAFVVFVSSLFGLNVLGNSARITLRLLSVVLLILVLVQLKQLRLGYLVPLLGNGIEDLLFGGFYCAGNMAIVSIIWLQSQKDEKNRGLLGCFSSAVLVTSLLLVLESTGHPVMNVSEFTRAARIEFVLSNGRMSLAPQFLLNILWYAGLLYLISAETASAANWIGNLNEHLPRWLPSSVAAVLVSMAAIWNPAWLQESVWFSPITYLLMGCIFVLVMLLVRSNGRGQSEWEKERP